MKKKKPTKKKEVIQWHHVDYERYPECKIPMYKREHFQITKLERAIRACKHKKTSKGYLFALKELCRKYWIKSEDIENHFGRTVYGRL